MPTFDPSQLRNDPETDAAARRPHDLTEHQKFISEIKGMLVDTRYAYAEETLRGILDTVSRKEIVTDGQRRAVNNILQKPQRATDQTWRRRY